MVQWKECVQRERKEQEDKSRALAMEARMSHGKSKEISRLRSDLQLADQEKKVQIIILFHYICMLSIIVMPLCNVSWLVCNCIAHWQMKKKELEEMEEMFLTKKEEMSVLNSVLESKETEIYELHCIVRMWYFTCKFNSLLTC